MDQKGNINDEKIIVHIDQDLEDLIPEYLRNRRDDIKAIEEALNKGDFESIGITGHSMKGSGGGYGFDAISEIGSAIENTAKEKNSVEIKKQIKKLSSYLDQVKVVYE